MNNDYKAKAIEKLDKEQYKGAYKYVAGAVTDALKGFCEQDEEFAQAIVQSDKSLNECIDKVLKGHGNCISDLEVYRRAVEFYFPGATVSMTLKIHVNPYDVKEEESKPSSVIELDLDDLI